MQATLSKKTVRRYHDSSSFKMAVFFTLLLGASAVILGYLSYDFSQKNFIRETEAAIDSEIASLLQWKALEPQQSMVSILQRRQNSAAGQFTLYMAPDGEPVAGNLSHLPTQVQTLKEGMIQFRLSAEDSRLIAAKLHTFADGARLLVGRDIDTIVRSYRNVQLLSLLMIGLMLVVISVSFFLSHFVVNRINLIAATARNIIDTGDLSRRISIDGKWDDLSDLAQVLNAMFARIEELMGEVRGVSDNIAHDLRTPLARLRNKLEELGASGDAPSQAVDDLIRDADQILHTFGALLRIASIESGKREFAFSPVEMAPLIEDVVAFYAPLAEERQLSLQVRLSPVTLDGDRDLLFQAVANLLDNAIKFTPVQGRVEVTLMQTEQGAELTVADTGCGVDDAELQKLCRRFYRAEQSRSTPGNGLGLSMVAAIATHHQAHITIENTAPGLRVRLCFDKINKM